MKVEFKSKKTSILPRVWGEREIAGIEAAVSPHS
jgi:hypothetical protein